MVQWVIWYEECVVKMACTPQQIKHMPPNWQASNFTSIKFYIHVCPWIHMIYYFGLVSGLFQASAQMPQRHI